jgi:hypothetical protein
LAVAVAVVNQQVLVELLAAAVAQTALLLHQAALVALFSISQRDINHEIRMD